MGVMRDAFIHLRPFSELYAAFFAVNLDEIFDLCHNNHISILKGMISHDESSPELRFYR